MSEPQAQYSNNTMDKYTRVRALVDLALKLTDNAEQEKAMDCLDSALTISDTPELRVIKEIVKIPLVPESAYCLDELDKALQDWQKKPPQSAQSVEKR